MRRILLIQESYQQALAAKPKDSINSALEISTVSFQSYEGQVLGAIVTPWFLGLLLLPQELEGWRDHQIGDVHREALPAGEFEFNHGWDPKFGAFGCCSLFSEMDEFPDQASALRVAAKAMEQLFVAPPTDSTTDTPLATTVEAEVEQQNIIEPPARNEAVDMKRRGLLTGSIFGRK